MAKYRIRVSVTAACEYEVEVTADSECDAENIAISMDAQKLPSDFQVNKGYVTDWEIDECEQLTYVCQDCWTEYPVDGPLKPWYEDQDYCAPCGLAREAEDARKDCNLAIAAIMNRAVDAGRNVDREKMFTLCSEAAQVEALRDYLK